MGEEKAEDPPGGAGFTPKFEGGALELIYKKDAPHRPHQGVPPPELHAEPGDRGGVVDGAQPEGKLRQLHRQRVEIHPEGAAIPEPHLHPLLLLQIGIQRDLLHELLLFGREVGLRQLIQHFVQKGGAPHGGLAEGELQHLICSFAPEQLLQGMAHQAGEQALGGVVGGAFLTLPPRQTIDEAPPGVFSDAPALFPNLLVLPVLLQLGGVDEVSHLKIVILGLFRAHLVEIFPGEEPRVGEQPLIDRPELAYPQPGIGDAPPGLSLAGAGEGEKPDHLLKHPVGELYPVQQGGVGGVEEVRGEGEKGEDIPVPAGGILRRKLLSEIQSPGALLLRLGRVPLEDQPKEHVQGVAEPAPLLGLLPLKRGIFHIPEGLQTVPPAVEFRTQGGIPQLRAGLHKEQKEKPVKVAQTLPGELGGVEILLPEEGLLLPVPDIPHRLVSQQLHPPAEGIAQIPGDLRSVAAGFLLQSIQQHLLSPLGAETPTMQQHRQGLQGALFPAGEDFVQIKAQRPLLPPLFPIQQQQLIHSPQKHPPGGLGEAEDPAGEKGLQGAALLGRIPGARSI